MPDETTGLSAMGETFAARKKAREAIEKNAAKAEPKAVSGDEDVVEDKAVKKTASKRKS